MDIPQIEKKPTPEDQLEGLAKRLAEIQEETGDISHGLLILRTINGDIVTTDIPVLLQKSLNVYPLTNLTPDKSLELVQSTLTQFNAQKIAIEVINAIDARTQALRDMQQQRPGIVIPGRDDGPREH